MLNGEFSDIAAGNQSSQRTPRLNPNPKLFFLLPVDLIFFFFGCLFELLGPEDKRRSFLALSSRKEIKDT